MSTANTKLLTNGLSVALALCGVASCDDVENGEFVYDAVEDRSGGGHGNGGPRLNTDVEFAEGTESYQLSLEEVAGPHIGAARVSTQNGMLPLTSLNLTADGELIGRRNKHVFQGADMIGAELEFVNGVSQNEKILHVVDYREGLRDNGEVGHFYELELEIVHHATFPFCSESLSESNEALFLKGIEVDHETLEVTANQLGEVDAHDQAYTACTEGAVGKLALWGFGPQDVGPQQYETGIRAALADYCWDANPQTEAGTEIYLSWDREEIDNIIGSGLAVEAMWGADGTLCIGSPRKANAQYPCGIPTCANSNHDVDDEVLVTFIVDPGIVI